MFGECHAHIFMDGVNYRNAAEIHQNHPNEQVIRNHLSEYQKAGVTFVRDGGDPYGAGILARSMAEEYGILYRTPVFAIHKKGHYGKIVGREYETLKEYAELVREVRKQGGNFIKIMTTGILDFERGGEVTGHALERKEVFELVHIAHEEGFAVMTHTNGAQAVMDAVEAGADSIEHGNYQNEESICCLAEHSAVWVPTLVTVSNLIGDGRYEDSVLKRICGIQENTLLLAFQKGVSLALGSDAGAYRVLHGKGIQEEYDRFCRILGKGDKLLSVLEEGEQKIRSLF